MAEERGLTLACSGATGMGILGDESLLFEAVSNLVENAVKFSPAGGQIQLGVDQNDQTITMVVTDSGPGISVDERAHVLGRFQRGSAGADIGTNGSGLGLSLVAVIVALHGFTLNLDPAGVGSSPGLVARISAPRVTVAPWGSR